MNQQSFSEHHRVILSLTFPTRNYLRSELPCWHWLINPIPDIGGRYLNLRCRNACEFIHLFTAFAEFGKDEFIHHIWIEKTDGTNIFSSRYYAAQEAKD